jgi:hypothetical protein
MHGQQNIKRLCKLILEYFRKSIEKIQISLKSDEDDGYFTWRPIYIYTSILLRSSLKKKY